MLSVTPGTVYSISVGGGGSPNGGSSSIDLGGNTLAIAAGGFNLGLGGTASTVPGPHIERGGGSTDGPTGALAGNAYGCPGPDGSLTGSGANYGDATSHAFPGYVLITW